MEIASPSWRTPEDVDYSQLYRHLIPFLQNCPFYAELSRHVQKKITRDIPTAAVAFDIEADQLTLWVNDRFFFGGSYKLPSGETINEEGLTDWEVQGVLIHEYDHPLFGHLGERRRQPSDVDNIAKDLAINSLIWQRQGRPRDAQPGEDTRPLPRIALVPGMRPYVDLTKISNLSPERKKAVNHLSDLIEKMPPSKASEWYFARLMEDKEKHPEMYPQGGDGIIVSMDSHDKWNETPPELQEYIEGKVRSIIEKAVRYADSHADGWGNIPAELREEIRRSVSATVDWRNVLRQYVGSLIRGHRTTSIKLINRRYPYIHPGVKRGYTAKLVVAIDESGSVGDEMLEMFFAELDQLTKRVDISILHFDCGCGESDVYEWKRGTRPKLKRERGGGTDFDAPTRFVNDPKNRGRWDGLLIMTDGQAPAPQNSRLKRGWILGQGCSLAFPSNETQIVLSKEKHLTGAWR